MNRTLYWSSTAILAGFLAVSAYSYLFSNATIDGIRELGFPDHFRYQLAVLKLIAVVVLTLPRCHTTFKEWAYVGSALFLLTAWTAHLAHGDGIAISLTLLALFAVLVISYCTFRRLG